MQYQSGMRDGIFFLFFNSAGRNEDKQTCESSGSRTCSSVPGIIQQVQYILCYVQRCCLYSQRNQETEPAAGRARSMRYCRGQRTAGYSSQRAYSRLIFRSIRIHRVLVKAHLQIHEYSCFHRTCCVILRALPFSSSPVFLLSYLHENRFGKKKKKKKNSTSVQELRYK